MKVRRGLTTSITYEGDIVGEGLSIALSQEDPSDQSSWFIRVFARIPQGEFLLGFLTTNFPVTDGAPARFVAFAGCPGVIGWRVEVTNASGLPVGNVSFDAEVWIQAGKCCGGGIQFGVFHPPQPPGSGGPDGGGEV